MNKVFIIAEAGVNHNGDMDTAKQLIEKACEAGADAVKFQTFRADMLVCRNAPKAEYQKENTSTIETQYEMLRKLELTDLMHRELKRYCIAKGILFMSTPFDIDSVDMLADLGMTIFKIPSGEITDLPYLRKVAEQGKKVILSTGMSSMEEVKAAVQVLRQNGTDDIILLHCNSQYPTPESDVNLFAMAEMMRETGLPVGYSDHTKGIEIPIAAAALGAVVIEKHFTLDRTMEGPDHKASLEPEELRQMVEGIRKVELALGDGRKQVSDSEKSNLRTARKSIIAGCLIEQGEFFTNENIEAKRPGYGISPMRWDDLVGRKAKRSYQKDELIYEDELGI